MIKTLNILSGQSYGFQNGGFLFVCLFKTNLTTLLQAVGIGTC